MEQQEIFNRLMAWKQNQLFDGERDEEYVGAILWDIAQTLDLTGEQAQLLAGDEIPDDLISITDAARIAEVSTQAIAGRIARGDLVAYTDKDEPNPTRSRRVCRADVEAIEWRPQHPSPIEELITSGTGASEIQHALAAMAREATGDIPRGQLWQPCERSGCDNEPVCMNCMMCEEKHCHCF